MANPMIPYVTCAHCHERQFYDKEWCRMCEHALGKPRLHCHCARCRSTPLAERLLDRLEEEDNARG